MVSLSGAARTLGSAVSSLGRQLSNKIMPGAKPNWAALPPELWAHIGRFAVQLAHEDDAAAAAMKQVWEVTPSNELKQAVMLALACKQTLAASLLPEAWALDCKLDLYKALPSTPLHSQCLVYHWAPLFQLAVKRVDYTWERIKERPSMPQVVLCMSSCEHLEVHIDACEFEHMAKHWKEPGDHPSAVLTAALEFVGKLGHIRLLSLGYTWITPEQERLLAGVQADKVDIWIEG